MMIAVQTYLKVKSLTIVKIKMSRFKCQIYKFGESFSWQISTGIFRMALGTLV